ncbi:MAG: leucine-rich repeat domain-containing protein [Eubacterium sp.]|nr:leucine-rich repeat domain-containing protein [Eubacterium sp.]
MNSYNSKVYPTSITVNHTVSLNDTDLLQVSAINTGFFTDGLNGACTNKNSITQVVINNRLNPILSNGATNVYVYDYFATETIPSHLFENMTGLTTFDARGVNGLKAIEDYTFSGCTSLSTVYLPMDAYSFGKIGVYAFAGCTSLKSIRISCTLNTLQGYAFKGCSQLATIDYPFLYSSSKEYTWAIAAIKDTPYYNNTANWVGGVVGKGILKFGNGKIALGVYTPATGDTVDLTGFTYVSLIYFADATVKHIIIPDSVKFVKDCLATADTSNVSNVESISIEGTTDFNNGLLYFLFGPDNEALYKYTSLKTLTVSDSRTDYCTVNNVLYNKDKTELIFSPQKNDVTGIVIPNSVQTIGENAFYANTNLQTVTMNNTVQTIGTSAFASCSALTSAKLSDEIKAIPANCFANCTKLENCIIPTGVETIGEKAFYNCKLASISIPDKVETLGNDAFSQNSNVKVLYVGKGLKSGLESMAGASKVLESAQVAAENTVYDSRNNCNAIIRKADDTLIIGSVNTVIPNTVKAIGDKAFYTMTFSKEITIPDSVTTIGKHAFYATNLTSIILPDSVTSIGAACFGSCPLTSVKLSDNLTAISNSAFSRTTIEEIVLPKSLTQIGAYAFNECSNLKKVYMYDKVTNIYTSAFNNTAIEDVYYSGTGADWNNLKPNIDTNNNKLTDANLITNFHLHEMQKTEAKPATCVAAGNNEYYYCTYCEKYFKDKDGNTETDIAAETLPIDPTAHKFDSNVKTCLNGCGTANPNYNPNTTSNTNPAAVTPAVTTPAAVDESTVTKNGVTLKLNKVTVKKSAKSLKVKATLKKKGKALKNKKITFKFNGKKYTAKTNKKGVATITVKKKVLKKLKVGKKIKITATYNKMTAKRTVKVKK